MLNLSPDLDAALKELARLKAVAREVLAVNALRDHIIPAAAPLPRDEWERSLLGAVRDCGVSLPNWALSGEGLYDYWPNSSRALIWSNQRACKAGAALVFEPDICLSRQ